MPRTLPPLGPLRAFEATVRLASMTAAAAELGRTHGAISRAVQALETSLQVRLLDRGGPTLRPTAAGAELFTAVTVAFEALERGMTRIAPRQERTQLRLACGSTFATRWLVPRLPRFYAANPAVSVSLVMIRRNIRDAEDVDLATTWDRLGYAAPRGPQVHVLGDARIAPVCRPDLELGREGDVVRVGRLLTSETWPDAWAAYERQAGLTLRREGEMRFPHLHHCIEAAVAGLGLTLVELRLVEDHLAAGRLVAPLGELRFPDGFVAVRSRPAAGRELRALIAWLRAELAAPPPVAEA